MSDIVEKKINEWIKGFSRKEDRIRIFERIRDIPFAIALDSFGLEKGPRLMLAEKKGFCVPKHYLMGMLFQRLELPVRYYSCSFRWSDLDVKYPVKLADAAKGLPIAYHMACEVKIGNAWVLADATWDGSLKKACFPVNDKWNGEISTRLAVKPLEEFIHEDARERELVFKEKMLSYSLPEKLRLTRFSDKLNRWMEEVRENDRSTYSYNSQRRGPDPQ